MVSVRVCAIIAGNYLPYARVLADSFFAQHPAGSLTILVIDDEERRVVPNDPRIDWRRLADLGIDRREIHRLAGIYDVTELATAVKPLLLRRLLDEGHGEVIFLDPDIRLYAPLDEVIPLARRHGIVLTPHTLAPYPRDGRQIDGRFVLGAGVYNLGFIAVGEAARPFLEWWSEATRREALMDFSRHMFTDQRWVDYAPALFEPHILKDPGYNVAYWNLHERTVTQADGQYLANGVPLRFFHFSGFEVQKPWLLSRHQGDRPRVLLSEQPILARLCHDYVASLERAGLDVDDPLPYGWRLAAAGIELTPRLRRLYWHALVASEACETPEPPDPFEAAHPRAFLDWLNSPAEHGPRRVSRFLYSIYRDRPDLLTHFPDLDGADAARYADWVWRYGVEQEPALFEMFELLPPRDGDELDHPDAAELLPQPPSPPARGITIVGEFGRASSGDFDRASSGEFSRASSAEFSRATDSRAATIGSTSRTTGSGGSDEIGGIAHLLKAGVEAARLPVSILDAAQNLRSNTSRAYEIVIVCLDPARTRTLPFETPPGFLAGRHTIGYWLWDIDPFPATLHPAFDAVDEVWAPTDYVADLLRIANRKPVFTVPLPIPVPTAPVEITREQLGLPADPFLFFARVDLASDVTRQNPVGAIEAFRAAFSPGQGPVLAIHLLNTDGHVPTLEQIRLAAAGRSDVRLLERVYSSDEQLALFGTCDAYLSLHRADALGLSIAKAMAVGKPAIATGYSGNLHFMTPENSYLVDCTPTVLPGGPAWVEPDLDHAAQLMREVYDRPFDAACKARRGQSEVFEQHGLWTSASAIRRRVEEIRQETLRAPSASAAAQPQTAAAAQPQTGAAAQPQTGAAAQSQTGAAAQSQTGAAAQSQTGAAAQSQTGAAAQPQTAAAPQLRPAATPQLHPAAAPQLHPDAAEVVPAVGPLADVAALETLPVEQAAEEDACWGVALVPEGSRPTSEAVAALEALVPRLEELGVPRVGAEGRALASVRVAAQRALFRVIQPYSFQQRQFQDALIGALVSSVKALASEVQTLAGEVSAARGETSARQAQAEAKTEAQLAAIADRLAETDTRLQELAAADAAAEASLTTLSQRVFVAPFDPGPERFRQRAANGDARLGYGATHAQHQSHVQPHARVNSHAVAATAVPLFRARQRLYLPLLKHRSRVLDIGCGRGAMLDLLRVARVPAVGIDLDPAMVSHCRANGHTVEHADALPFLRTQPDASVGAIFSARFLERLPFEQVQEFLRLCRSRLEHGGLLIAETANPRDFGIAETAISPEVVLALCQQAGFEQAQVVFPTGTGALDPDRQSQSQYAVLATAGLAPGSSPSITASAASASSRSLPSPPYAADPAAAVPGRE